MTSATNDFIPLSIPEIRGNEWRYIKKCLDTNLVSSVGPFVDHFEAMMGERIGGCAVATVSGTAALHVALLLASVQAGDEVLVSDLTFIAPANAVRYVGAYPVFVDAEPAYWQMDTSKLADFLEHNCTWRRGELRNKDTQRRVRAILPVHILGHPVDMDPLIELARGFNLRVIEDATESLSSLYKGQPVGILGDIGCFSFNGNKLITTGGGGMIVTRNEEWASKAKYLTTQAKDDPVEFIHREIGFNYRLTNIQAALGVAQMEMLDQYVAAKRRIASHYTRALREIPGVMPMRESPSAFSSYWLYTVRIDKTRYGTSSRGLLNKLERVGIQCRPLWQPMHSSKAHHGAQSTDCAVAEELHRTAISLPCSVGLTEEQQIRTINEIRRVHESIRKDTPVSVGC